MKVLVLFILVASGAYALPLNSTRDASKTPLWMRSGKWEGDIVLTPEQKAALRGGRNGLVNTYYRWNDRTIPYVLKDGDFNAAQTQSIISALEQYNTQTCLTVRQATSADRDYVLVTREDTGCWSYVGRLGGVQQLNLQDNAYGTCLLSGIVVHEFMHAAGFYHEQSATDRDEYVQIFWENIDPVYWYAFDKYGTNLITSFGVGYDLKSVMHYENWSFTINGQPTIQSIQDPSLILGNNVGFTEKDIRKVNAMYGC